MSESKERQLVGSRVVDISNDAKAACNCEDHIADNPWVEVDDVFCDVDLFTNNATIRAVEHIIAEDTRSVRRALDGGYR